MSRRVVLVTASVAALMIGLILLFTAPDPDREGIALLAPPKPTEFQETLAELPAPSVPVPPPQSAPSPLMPAASPDAAAATNEFAGTTKIVVTVLIEGRPLIPVLDDLGIAYQDVHVVATPNSPGASLDESLAPFYSRQGLGNFSSHRNDWNEDRVVGPPGCLGELTVPLQFPMHVSVALGSAVLATRVLEEPQPELTFELPLDDVSGRLGKLRGRFVSATSKQPIAGGELTINALAFVMSSTKVTADDQGLIEHAAVSGPVWVSATAAGFEQLAFLARVPRGKTCDLGDVELHPAGTVSGIVRQATGDPVAEGLVALVPLDTTVNALQSIAMAMLAKQRATDEGRFALPSGRRRYLLVAYEDKSAAVVPVDATNGDVSGLELTLKPFVMLTLRLPPNPLDSIRLRLWTKDGLPVTSWPGWLGSGDDEATIVPLVPGEYLLAVDSRSRGKWTRAITLGTESMTIDIGEEDRK